MQLGDLHLCRWSFVLFPPIWEQQSAQSSESVNRPSATVARLSMSQYAVATGPAIVAAHVFVSLSAADGADVRLTR
jgi:hypothetical protein